MCARSQTMPSFKSAPPAGRGSAFNLDTGLARLTQLTVNNRDLWILKPTVSSTEKNVSVYHVEHVDSQRSKNDTSACRMFTWLSPVTQAYTQLNVVYLEYFLSATSLSQEPALLCNQAFSGSGRATRWRKALLFTGKLQPWIKSFSFKCQHC